MTEPHVITLHAEIMDYDGEIFVDTESMVALMHGMKAPFENVHSLLKEWAYKIFDGYINIWSNPESDGLVKANGKVYLSAEVWRMGVYQIEQVGGSIPQIRLGIIEPMRRVIYQIESSKTRGKLIHFPEVRL